MEPSALDTARLERLARDHRRMSIIYGLSIISLALVVTAMVWVTPSFQLFSTASYQGVAPTDFISSLVQTAAATTTP